MTAIGVGSALWSRQRIRRLAELPLRHIELVWIALAIQLIGFEVTAPRIPLWSTELLHYVSYVLPLAFIIVNRHLPGAWLIALGASCNLLAIAAQRRIDAGQHRRMGTRRASTDRPRRVRELEGDQRPDARLPRRRVRDPCRMAARRTCSASATC